jgi:hypothetical protein
VSQDIILYGGVSPLVGFDFLQQQVNLIRRFLSNAQTPDSAITRLVIQHSPKLPQINHQRGEIGA